MKILKAMCTAAILAMALSVPAYAGQIETPGYVPPPPPPPESNITVEISVPMATSFDLRDTSSPGFMELMWALASIF